MRIFFVLLTGCLLSACKLSAQVTAELVMEDEYYLAGESIPVGVRITNLSGQTLNLGKAADWLTFSVEARDNFIVSKLGEPPVTGEFSLESSTLATKRVDIAPYFQLTMPGRYTLAAMVRIPQWDREVNTKPRNFVISSGRPMWEIEFGVPMQAGKTMPPEERKYTLLQAQHLKEKKLYVRVTDKSENKIFTVMPVGPVVAPTRPEPQLDKLSNLHLLFQTGARSFSYVVVNPDGQIVVRQTHEYTNTRPTLKADKEGNIVVAGGVRRLAASDLPPYTAVAQTNEIKTPKP